MADFLVPRAGLSLSFLDLVINHGRNSCKVLGWIPAYAAKEISSFGRRMIYSANGSAWQTDHAGSSGSTLHNCTVGGAYEGYALQSGGNRVGMVSMTILILVFLIPVAYAVGRIVQWNRDANRVMGSWNRKR
jgi:hypothetical protein